MVLDNQVLKDYCKHENDKIKEIRTLINEIMIDIKQKKTLITFANLNQLYTLLKSDFILKFQLQSIIFSSKEEVSTIEEGITFILRQLLYALGFPQWFVDMKKDSDLIKILMQFIQTQKQELKINELVSEIEPVVKIENDESEKYAKVNSSLIVNVYCIINDLKREANNKDTVALITELNRLYNLLAPEFPPELDSKPTIDLFKSMVKNQPFTDQLNSRLDGFLKLLNVNFNSNDSPTIKVNKIADALSSKYPVENNYWEIRK